MNGKLQNGYVLIALCVFIFVSTMITAEMMRTVILEKRMLETFKIYIASQN